MPWQNDEKAQKIAKLTIFVNFVGQYFTLSMILSLTAIDL